MAIDNRLLGAPVTRVGAGRQPTASNSVQAGHSLVIRPQRAEASLDDYFRDFGRIWVRDRRERTAFDLWAHVSYHCCRVVDASRVAWRAGVVDDLADTTAWLFSFIAQLQGSAHPADAQFRIRRTPSEMILRRFPLACPRCVDAALADAADLKGRRERLSNEPLCSRRGYGGLLASGGHVQPCVCHERCAAALTPDEEKRRAMLLRPGRLAFGRAVRAADMTTSRMCDLEKLFSELYGHAQASVSLERVSHRLLEASARVAEALTDCYTYDDVHVPYSPRLYRARLGALEDRIADVFSWLFAMALKLRDIVEVPVHVRNREPICESALAEFIWLKYGRTRRGVLVDHLLCPGCEFAPCRCRRDLHVSWFASEAALSESRTQASTASSPAM